MYPRISTGKCDGTINNHENNGYNDNSVNYNNHDLISIALVYVWYAKVPYCNEWHSFHARVGRFSPFLYLRSVAIAVILFWLQLVVLVSPCFLGSRIPRDYRFPRAPLFLCSERKSS